MPKQPLQKDVNHIMQLLNQQLHNIYIQLQYYGIKRNAARDIFKLIVAYTVSNESKYPGKPKRKTEQLLTGFWQEYPWVFYFLNSAGMPSNKMDDTVKLVMVFTLSNLKSDSMPLKDFDETANQITNQIRRNTDVFMDLDSFGVTASIASSIVKTAVLFTLKHLHEYHDKGNIQHKATEIIERFRASYPDIIEDLKQFGLPNNEINNILRTIIVFSIRKANIIENY